MYSANARKIAAYRKVRVQTSDPGQILLMLYDGAIRFCGNAKEAMEEMNIAKKGEFISKTYAILIELQATLNHDVAPELCQNLSSLYQFMMEQLVNANINNEPKDLDSVVELLGTLRDGWQRAVDESNKPQSVTSLNTKGESIVSFR